MSVQNWIDLIQGGAIVALSVATIVQQKYIRNLSSTLEFCLSHQLPRTAGHSRIHRCDVPMGANIPVSKSAVSDGKRGWSGK